MTAYLTDDSDPEEIARGHRDGIFTAVKLYPARATTNSAHGVTDIARTYPVLERLQALGIPLLIHGEVTDPEIDVFDREAVFIERVLAPLMRRMPQLKLVLEHVTTQDAVDFVGSAGDTLAATITAHHLLINRNALFAGGLRPHMYCLPVAKREKHRLALRRAATSGDARFFSAPTRRRIRSPTRSAIAAAPASSPLPRRWRSMRRYSPRSRRSTASRLLPRSMGRAFMAFPPTSSG